MAVLPDEDADDLNNLLEFYLLGLPGTPSPGSLPSASVQDDYLTLTFTHNLAAENVSVSGQVSEDAVAWAPAITYRTIYHGDGTATTTLRAPAPIPANRRQFIRATFEAP